MKIFKSCIIILLSLFTFKASSQTVDCFKFKTGKFRVTDPRIGGVTITERQGSYQTESNEALKLKIRFNITWLSDCSYTLKLDQVLRNENKVEVPSNLTISVTIIATEKDSYTQEISSSMYSSTYRCTATRQN